jgi:hypothetical protein
MWNVTNLKVKLGDIVVWNWNYPSTITGMKVKVEQVADAASTAPTGFSSGTPTSSGK